MIEAVSEAQRKFDAQEARERSMNLLKGGKERGFAVFNSKYAQQRTYPLGPPRYLMVGSGNAMERQYLDGPCVDFERNRFETNDPDIAEGLVRDKLFCERWWLETSCIPAAIREFYPRLPVETKRRIAIALIRGAETEEVFDTIDQEEIDSAAVTINQAGTAQAELNCPVEGCGMSFVARGTDSVKNAQAAVIAHINIMHPDAKL